MSAAAAKLAASSEKTIEIDCGSLNCAQRLVMPIYRQRDVSGRKASTSMYQHSQTGRRSGNSEAAGRRNSEPCWDIRWLRPEIRISQRVV